MIMFYRLAHFTLFPLEEVRIEMTFKDMFKQWTSNLFHTNYLDDLSKHTEGSVLVQFLGPGKNFTMQNSYKMGLHDYFLLE